MALTITATVGGATSNSYITESELTAYLATCLHLSATVIAAQAQVGTDTIKRAIITATRLLDEQIEWDGEPTDADVQMLQWPRSGLVDDKGEDLDEDIIPTRLKNATSELAKILIDSDITSALSSDGIEALKVGSIAIDFDVNNPPVRTVIPDYVYEMIALWGKRKYGRGPMRNLIRA